MRAYLQGGFPDLDAVEGRLSTARPERPRTIMIVSAGSGEGRTTTAACLGWSLSASGRVLLVDAHLHRPDLSRMFGLDQEVGLTDLLSGCAERPAVFPTDRERLHVLPRGQSEASSAELLRSGDFVRCLAEPKLAWDYVVIDTPPFLAHSDAVTLARHVDVAVIVLDCERTRWEVGRLVAERLHAAGGHLLGAVLNRRRFHVPGPIYRVL